ncbi:MAG: hypothetical protein ACLFR1_16195 [Spirochaetia bacterium]
MSDDVLSGDEIDNLLGQIEAEAGMEDENDESPQQEAEESGPKIKIYDYLRPDLLTESALHKIHTIIEDNVDRFTEKMAQIGAPGYTLKITSIDSLTMGEYTRSTPDPCIAVKIGLPNNTRFYIEAGRPAAVALCALYLGQPVTSFSENTETSVLRKLFAAVIEHVLGDKMPDAVVFEPLHIPGKLITLSRYEPVILCAAELTLQDKPDTPIGMVNICLPYLTLIKMLPDEFREYTNKTKKAFPQTSTSNTVPDVWFKRCIEFPIIGAAPSNIAGAIENGKIELTGELSGHVIYKEKS